METIKGILGWIIIIAAMFGWGMFKASGDCDDSIPVGTAIERCGNMKNPLFRMGYIYYMEHYAETLPEELFEGATFGGAVKVYRQMR